MRGPTLGLFGLGDGVVCVEREAEAFGNGDADLVVLNVADQAPAEAVCIRRGVAHDSDICVLRRGVVWGQGKAGEILVGD